MRVLVLLSIKSTRNLKCLASPTPKIWLGQNIKTGHVTLTTPISTIIPRLALDIFYLHKKFDDLPQPFRRHDCGYGNWKWVMWLTTPLLGMACQVVNRNLGLYIIYLCAKFGVSSFTFHRYGSCLPKFKWFTWPDHATFRDGLPSMG